MEIKTAHDFIKQCGKAHWAYDTEHYTFDDIERAMIRFAEYHVQNSLKAASENAKVKTHTESWGDYETSYNVDTNSILNSYPLDNIV